MANVGMAADSSRNLGGKCCNPPPNCPHQLPCTIPPHTHTHLPAPQSLLCLQRRKRQALHRQRRLEADAAEGAKAAQRLQQQVETG